MRHRSLLSFIVAATLTLGLGSTVAASVGSTPKPALTSSHREQAGSPIAQSAGVTGQGQSVTVSVVASAPVVAPASAESDPTDANRPAEPDRHGKDTERIRLHCEGVATAAQRPAIGCAWSASEAPRFAGYRLVRRDGDHGAVVFETRDRSQTAFLDHKVRPGATYRYVVQVLGPQGQVIGMSEPSTARAPGRSEEIRLACEPVSNGSDRGVGCKWSEAHSPEARGYTLARSIDGGPLERIFQKGLEGPNYHVDGPLRGGHRYTYVVLVLDEAGQVIGHSQPVTVGWPSEASPPAVAVPR